MADKLERKLWQSNFIKAKSNLLKITQQWALLQNKENPKRAMKKYVRLFETFLKDCTVRFPNNIGIMTTSATPLPLFQTSIRS